MDVQYTITLNEKQTRLVSRALELFSRIQTGQFDTILDWKPGLTLNYEKTREIRTLLKQAVQMYTGQLMGCTYSILSPEVNDEARIAYDIHQVIRHRLYWDKNPESKTFWFVDGDEPWKTSRSESLATIKSSKANNEALIPDLTDRERVVLKYIWEKGYNPKQMARDLVVSNHTVKSHVKAILQKLCVNNMTDAIVQAIRLKIVEV